MGACMSHLAVRSASLGVCVVLLLMTNVASAQIPRRIPGRTPASQPATDATAAADAPSSRPVEPYSPPADAPLRRPSGYVGSSPLRSGGGSSDFLPIPDRWRIGGPPETRFNSEVGAYGGTRTGPLDPYKQNVLKGDYPIIGQDIFLSISAISDTLFETRRL